jgi:CRISPR-associated protein Cmr3
MTTHTVFLEPLDVLFLRGNKLFGDPGSFGESLVPPWPSVAAGALRSRMLADARLDWSAARRDEPVAEHPALGTPERPGSFALTAFDLARRAGDGKVEILMAPPADLVVTMDERGQPQLQSMQPHAVALQSSAPLPQLAVLAEHARGKPASGYWLSQAGWAKYLAGQTLTAAELVNSSELWALDYRVGIGLDAAQRRAAEGKLFSVQAVAPRAGVGFVAAVAGAEPPARGTVRLGGDGRAAALSVADVRLPEPDYEGIARNRRCRLVLTTPGIFARGWLPTGAAEPAGDGARFELHGVRGRIVCAALPRAEVVSGWDLAKWQPKPAQRIAPAGSVYWLEELDATPDALRKLVDRGLWTDGQYNTDMRRAEGFNRFTFAAY